MTQISISGPAGTIFVDAEELQADGARTVSRGVVQDLAQAEVAQHFKAVLGFVRQAVDKSVDAHAPKKIEVELSLAMTTGGNFLVVKGDATASIKIKAIWERS